MTESAEGSLAESLAPCDLTPVVRLFQLSVSGCYSTVVGMQTGVLTFAVLPLLVVDNSAIPFRLLNGRSPDG